MARDGHEHATRRRLISGAPGAFVALVALVAFVPVGVVAAPDSAHPVAATSAALVLDGHGYGHGIGLSQYGALGYAVDFGWSSAAILDHYYANTVAATATNGDVTVRLSALDGAQAAVVQDHGTLVVDGAAGGPWRSVVARSSPGGGFDAWARADAAICPPSSSDLSASTAGWTRIAVASGSVTVHPATDTTSSGDVTDLAGVCEPATGRVRYYRGALAAVADGSGVAHTVNRLPVEQYVRSVVAGEMSWGWAQLGGGRGAQALQAQAVAARSYALAENRQPYAMTCDDVCQTYRGAGYRAGVGAPVVLQEFAATDAAVAATAGVVRRFASAGGAIATTMYSSSSGGFTATSSLGFPPVADEGDAITANGAHAWTATVAAAAIETAYPTIGAFSGITVTTRDGHGEWGGRVLTMTVVGAAGSIDVTGAGFRTKLRLRSTWFHERGAAGLPSAVGAAPAPATEGCAGRTAIAAPSGGAVADASASAFTAVTPRRLIDTRIGLGTERLPLGGGCTIEVDPHAGDDATAVVVNVTAVSPAVSGYLTAYPCGAERPVASIVPAVAGRIVPGAAIVALNAEGLFCVYAMATTEIVIDLSGVYHTDGGDGFAAIPTERRYDSRGGALVPSQSVVRVPVAGLGGVPASARAITATVHSTDATHEGFVTLWPCDPVRPTTSILNTTAATSITNHIEVGLDDSGAVCMFAQYAMHLVLDVSGWFGPSATGRFHALSPARVLDTRAGIGLDGAFAAGQDRALSIVGVAGVPLTGVTSVAAEVTSTGAQSAGYITVHPCLNPVPEVSMVRNLAGTVAATTVTGILDGLGRWCLRPSVAMHVVVDVSGWYG